MDLRSKTLAILNIRVIVKLNEMIHYVNPENKA